MICELGLGLRIGKKEVLWRPRRNAFGRDGEAALFFNFEERIWRCRSAKMG